MVFNEEIVVIDSPPSPCPHQPKPTKQSQQLPPSTVTICRVKAKCQRPPRLSTSCGSTSSTSSESSTLPSATATAAASPDPSFQQQLLIRRKFVDVVKRLCSQLANKMSTKTGSHQNKIKDLKQVAPLQVPKEEADVTEPVQLGDVVLLRKSSANGKVTVYLPKIEYEDLGCVTEPVEGIVTYDPTKLDPGEKVYIALVGRFRYGREEDEILGMSLCREIYMGYAPVCSNRKTLSPQGSTGSQSGSPQDRKREKDPIAGPSSGITAQLEHQKSLGGVELSSSCVPSKHSIPLSPFHEATLPSLPPESIPFRFEFPGDTPVSMVMQRTTPDSGDTCGVRYYVRCYSCLDIDDQPTTISLLNFPIKKVQYMSLARNLLDHSDSAVLPKGTIFKEFPLNGGNLSLEATLNKAVYEHGEEIRVKIHLSNSSHKTIKHVKVSILQVADICLFSTGKWKVCVATTNNRNDCPISSGNSIEQEVVLVPKVGDNKHKYGVFVQSRSGPEPDCLASSTIVSEEQRKNLFGIVVDYEVKVKLCLGTLSSLSGRGEIACFIPFQILHSGPAEIPLPGTRASTIGHGAASNGDLRIGSAGIVEQMEQLQLDAIQPPAPAQ